jgi:flagellar biosynthesis chaperone FliJ
MLPGSWSGGGRWRNRVAKWLSKSKPPARAALAEAFQEVKRHETVVAGRARQQRLREERRDQRVLDDLGAEGFRRRRAGQE